MMGPFDLSDIVPVYDWQYDDWGRFDDDCYEPTNLTDEDWEDDESDWEYENEVYDYMATRDTLVCYDDIDLCEEFERVVSHKSYKENSYTLTALDIWMSHQSGWVLSEKQKLFLARHIAIALNLK